MPRSRALAVLAAAVLLVSWALSACGGTSDAAGRPPATIRLGYFPNVTHATAIVADKEGLFARHLGGTRLGVSTFGAGPAAMEALESGAVDATFVGPGPATNAYLNSGGEALRVVAGAASGGSALVVDPSVTSAAGLRGRQVSSPGLGNTQDIALRYWLRGQGLRTDLQGGGDVTVVPQGTAQIVQAFTQKQIAGAWVPEPYVTRLVQAGGTVLVDERDLWPGGRFAATVLAVRTDFLRDHPRTVMALLAGELDATAFITAHPARAQRDVAALIAAVSGKPLDTSVVTAGWASLQFTVDPVAGSLLAGARHAHDVGVLRREPHLDHLLDLTLLNTLLTERGKPEITP